MTQDWMACIGHTPLVRLSRLFPGDRDIAVYAKLEMMNPSGSAKDRPAAQIIAAAREQGLIGPGSVVIESSSGNMAISMAAICSRLDMRFISVIDPRTTPQNIHIMQAYGAEVELVEQPDPATGEFLPARLERVRQLLARIPNSYWPNQYENPNNYMAHRDGTMREVAAELDRVDCIFGGVSTCGTLLGCASYVQEHRLDTRIIAVDAEGSVILGGEKGRRLFPGLGAGIVPPFGHTAFMDQAVQVPEAAMVAACRRLARREAILAGPSSGAVISALERLYPSLPDGSVCVAILHDRGERYMDTLYNDAWVAQHFGGLV
ncbi:2,3-diaminopropionate biosynthesis protein SbnA [Paenibacillus sp. 1P07SE]|uniref:2,3-diaminopropionate biosynthesis protein SbnA n=1 Tax=Paenibacillus sp. 1P07SE TaxID=3132209 RepID=UPI0039A7372C